MTAHRDAFPDLPSFLAEVRRRPTLYLSAKSTRALSDVLLGIEFAERWHGIAEASRFGGFDVVGFEKWVDGRFNSERLSLRSLSLAEYLAGPGGEGLDLWFAWYDEYRGGPSEPSPAAT